MGLDKFFHSVLRFLKDIKLAIRPRTCNLLLALLQMEETCWSKLSSVSIKIPSKVSFLLVVSEASPIDTSVGVLELTSKRHSRIGFKMIILDPVKKFVRDKF